MKASPYMNINRIEFIVTYQCSGKCRHCSIGERLNCKSGFKHVDNQAASDTIERLSQMFPISSVMTFGGEPLLYPDTVYAIHKKADLSGVNMKQLITNGYFTKDMEKCRLVAEGLSKSGLNNLLISVDVFHQETISLEIVHHFARYAKEAGIPKIQIHPAWVVNQEHENEFNTKTKEILVTFTDLDIPVSNGNNIFMAGNAVKNLEKYYEKPSLNLADSCGSMPYTEPLTDITSVSIVPNGDVMVCGFVIGNIYRDNIEEIILRYNPYEDECMSALISGGGSALVALAKEKGITVDISKCYSVCDLCHKISKLVRS